MLRLCLHRSRLFACLAALVVAGCGGTPEVVGSIKSPDGEVILTVSKSDPGACCTNRVLISGNVFGEGVEELAEIKGSSDVRYAWSNTDTLSVLACNAKMVSLRSGFQNSDFSRRFILSVENERPQEDRDRVLCSSGRFERMTPL